MNYLQILDSNLVEYIIGERVKQIRYKKTHIQNMIKIIHQINELDYLLFEDCYYYVSSNDNSLIIDNSIRIYEFKIP